MFITTVGILGYLSLPCSRVVEASQYKAIVLPVLGNDIGIQLREQDQSWKDFLAHDNQHHRYVMSTITAFTRSVF